MGASDGLNKRRPQQQMTPSFYNDDRMSNEDTGWDGIHGGQQIGKPK
jgi:hypothetical protein